MSHRDDRVEAWEQVPGKAISAARPSMCLTGLHAAGRGGHLSGSMSPVHRWHFIRSAESSPLSPAQSRVDPRRLLAVVTHAFCRPRHRRPGSPSPHRPAGGARSVGRHGLMMSGGVCGSLRPPEYQPRRCSTLHAVIICNDPLEWILVLLRRRSLHEVPLREVENLVRGEVDTIRVTAAFTCRIL